jgi:hypothetical protein
MQDPEQLVGRTIKVGTSFRPVILATHSGDGMGLDVMFDDETTATYDMRQKVGCSPKTPSTTSPTCTACPTNNCSKSSTLTASNSPTAGWEPTNTSAISTAPRSKFDRTAGLGTVTSKSGEIWVNLKENYLEKYPE